MKKIKVSLDFKSPLLIGGRKSSNNFITTDEVIKGSVVRAAFAKVILNHCPVRHIKSKDGRANWIFKRNMECCNSCKYKKFCEKFQNIKFSYFYPKGSEAIPLSSMICKKDRSHGFIDCLIDKKECETCGDNGRVEFESGLRTIGEKKIPFDLKKSISVKTSINPYTKTSADGMLYSIETITSTDNKNQCIYEGYIELDDDLDLHLFDRLRVGGDTTVGLGKCTTDYSESLQEYNLKNIEAFSDSYKTNNGVPEDKEINFVAIKFIGDLKVNFNKVVDEFKTKEEIIDDYLTAKQYKKIWEMALGLKEDSKLKLEKIYTEIINYRGYDTSKSGKDKRAEVLTLAAKGSVLVFSSNKSVKDMCNILYPLDTNLSNSFGEDTENGFGEYVLYDGR